ncbi:5-formyltetrahydrofolate cyclo-ligase [Salinarimonas sp.]|uniref:5-formyltetrahydrofolate cyclo-ligase n=1 Tax=Salinarimonas sp. TaxID=2766526 RepID=UPI00391A0A85
MDRSPLDKAATTDKALLRREGIARREALAADARAAASARIVERLLAMPEVAAARVVAGYWPMRAEVDPRAAFAPLVARGIALALPFVADPTLVFRAYAPGDALVRGPFGVEAPGEGAPAVRPDLLLVPLARFDRACHRIGYGKGHYDRALAALSEKGPVVAIGLAFAVQEAQTVPAEDHDRALDAVITEDEVLRASGSGGRTR